MANLNKVMLIGNVTRDPEIKYTPKGSAVTDLGIAINRFYTPEGGEKREETTFVDVTLWGRQAEIAGEYCKKGRSIYIEGRLQLDSWEDKTSGQKRTKLRVIGENIQLLGNRVNAHGGSESNNEYAKPPLLTKDESSGVLPPASSKISQNPIEEDDIPF